MTDTPETNETPEVTGTTETTDVSEATPEVPIVIPRRRSPIRRAGCIIAVVIWFVILLLPCFLIVLAVQQEIMISTGSVPGQQIRLWLISEAEARGLAISTASTRQTDENAVCVQTNVRYFLWAGKSDPSSYCDCYQRVSADASWVSTSTTSGACSGTG